MLTLQGLSSRSAWVGLLCLLAVAFLSACDGEPTPDPTATPTTDATSTTVPKPTPTYEPLVHVPGQFGVSADSTTTEYVEPIFPCGPSMDSDLEYAPEVLLWAADGSGLVLSYRGSIWTVDAQGVVLQKVLHALRGNTSVSMGAFKFGFHADLSPDGTRLVYTACQFQTEYEDTAYAQSVIARSGSDWYERSLYNYEIALTGLDGDDQRRVTHNRWPDDHYPVWSPDGSRIAFTRGGGLYNGQLYTMSPDGSDVQSVGLTGMKVARVPPVWSPDGQRLAFGANEGEMYPREERNVYTVRLDGSDLAKVGEMGGVRYVGWAATTAAPAWRPDGERLAFAGFDGQELFIHTARFDGSDLRQVWSSVPVSDSKSVSQVSWSPDGSELLFVADGVYIVNPDGGGLRELLAPSNQEIALAAWSPGGSRIAIYTILAGYGSAAYLATMNRDGTDFRVLAEADRNGELQPAQSTQPEATTVPEPEPTATAPPPGFGQ